MPESNEEVWLERDDFMSEFCFADENSIRNFVDKGLPRKMIKGGGGKGMSRYLYPRNACHRFFAGEDVVNI